MCLHVCPSLYAPWGCVTWASRKWPLWVGDTTGQKTFTLFRTLEFQGLSSLIKTLEKCQSCYFLGVIHQTQSSGMVKNVLQYIKKKYINILLQIRVQLWKQRKNLPEDNGKNCNVMLKLGWNFFSITQAYLITT